MIKNQPKSIFIKWDETIPRILRCSDTKYYDTDLEYISLDALREGKAENELAAWFLVNLLRRPEMAEHIAKSLIERGFGKSVIVEEEPGFDGKFINA